MTIYPIGTKNDDETRNIINNNFGFLRENSNELLRQVDDVKKYIDNKGEEILSEAVVKEWLSENEFKPKDAVATFNDLPKDAELKELRGVIDENTVYVYDGTKWVKQSNLNFDGLNSLKLELEQYSLLISNFPKLVPESDDTARLKRAILEVEKKGIPLKINEKTLKISSTVTLKGGTRIYGHEGNTTINVPTGGNFTIFKSSDTSNVTISGITINGGGAAGTTTKYIIFERVKHGLIENVIINNPSTMAIYMLDCDFSEVNNAYIEYDETRYTNSTTGYAVLFDGCKYCTISNSNAKRVTFGFLIIGNDTDGKNDHLTTRSYAEAYGNTIINCNVIDHSAPAFDLNSVPGTTVINCTSDNTTKSNGSKIGFQSKNNGTKGYESETRFINCTARNCGTGMLLRAGSNIIVSGLEVSTCDYGLVLAGTTYSITANIIIDGYSKKAIHLYGNATNNTLSTLIARNPIFDSDSTVISFEGSSYNEIKGLYARNKADKGVEIDSTSMNNNFYNDCRIFNNTINDLSNTTKYPIEIMKEIKVKEFGPQFLGYSRRGINIAKIQVIALDTITGTTDLSIGKKGNSSFIKSPVTLDSSISINYYSPTNSLIAPNETLNYFIPSNSNAGSALVNIQGFMLN